MKRLATILTAAALSALLLAGAATAATITPALEEGDNVAGVGLVTRIDNLAVNSTGSWLVEADTDNADTNLDQVIVRDGVLYLREGDALAEPAGATIDSFDSVNLNDNGDSGWNFFLDGTSGTNDDSGIFFNTALVIQESDISIAPEFTPGTPYIGFFDAKIHPNDSSQIMSIASIDDPNIASTVDRGLMIITHDGTGNLVSETAFLKEGDVPPGVIEPILDFGTGPHQSAFNDAGTPMFFVDLDAASSSEDGALYVGNQLIAREGSPSPVAGRNWDFLSSRGLDLSNSGAYVHKGNLDGDTADDELIIRNGAVLIREGDSLPAIAPYVFTSFGTTSGPVQIDDAGNVLWYGDWDEANTDKDTGLFLNDQLIVQEGVTEVNGVLIDTINSGQDAFALSDNGFYAIFEATLDDGTNGAYLIELGGPVSIELSQLAAVPVDRQVEVTWSTSVEYQHDGFHVYRADSRNGSYDRLTDELVRGGPQYRFVDRDVQGGATYWYQIGAVDLAGHEDLYGPVSVTTPRFVKVAGMAPVAPNPFVRKTELRFSVPRGGAVSLQIFDVAGRRVRDLSGVFPVGNQVLEWDGRDDAGKPLPAGVYFARFAAEDVKVTRKVVRIGH
jgi:hypothetical protein